MNYSNNYYPTIEEKYDSKKIIRYYFISVGNKKIVKAVQYDYIKNINNIPLYNLGFGDFNRETGQISDNEISNNNDQYTVFHTVLNTIPRLFETCGNIILMVQGSDSKPEFKENCTMTCTRKCKTGECKKAHRRMNIYRNFLDKNLDQLSNQYLFWGGDGIEDYKLLAPYEKGKNYMTVITSKKKS